MDQIGTSQISGADVIVVVIFGILISGLRFIPANSRLSSTAAIIAGCLIAATPFVIIFGDLARNGIFFLSFLVIHLCGGVWQWKRDKDNLQNKTQLAG
jgi:predicted membrane-bound mannosyltransferase